MRHKLLLLLTATIVLASVLSGCGGGGSGPAGQPSSTMMVGADTAVPGARATRADIAPGAPLESGAQVTVYDFSTGEVVGTGVTGLDGMCSVKTPPGASLAVVITGEKAGKKYRLSTIVPVAPIDGGRFIADPVTSMAAEAISLKYFGKTAIDKATVDKVLAVAQDFANTHSDVDYCISGGIFSGTDWGKQGCMDASMMHDVLSSVPDTIDNTIVMTRNAVQQIKDAGIPMASVLQQERPDIEKVFSAATAPKYQALIDRLGTIMLPAMFGGMQYKDSDGNPIWPRLFDLEEGKAYTVQRIQEGGEGWSNSYLQLTDLPEGNVAGQITLVYAAEPGTHPMGTYTVSATHDGSSWMIKQTFTGDSEQDYRLTIPSPGADPGENPSLTVGISLKDSEFTQPLTFDGMLSATGPDRSSYTKISLDGRLSTPEVAASGKLEADFPSTLPSGADPDTHTIYDFPTGFSISNADIKLTDELTIITTTGTISATMVPYGSGVSPNHIAMNGTYGNTHTGLKFEGNIVGDWTNPPATSPPDAKGTLHIVGTATNTGHPTYSVDLRFTLDGTTSNADIAIRAGSASLTGTANCTFKSDGKVKDGTLDLRNQNDVRFALSTNTAGAITGSITTLGQTMADITRNGDFMRITYRSTPVTFDEYPIKW